MKIDAKTSVRRFRSYLEVEQDFVATTAQRYERNVKMWLVHLGRRRKHWADISKEDCSKWFADVKQRYKPATARQILSALRKFYTWASSEGYYKDANWWDMIKPPKVIREKKPVLTDEQLWTVFNSNPAETFYNIRNRAIVMLMLGSGLRNSETRLANVNDVRLEADIIFVQHGKGRKTRTQPMPKPTTEAIRHWLLIRSLWACGSDKLFVNRDGTTMSRNAIWEATKSYFRECGLDDSVYPHMLRRTGGTKMWENGAEPKQVQAWFGHVKMDTTLDYVSSADPRVAEAVDESHPFAIWSRKEEFFNETN